MGDQPCGGGNGPAITETDEPMGCWTRGERNTFCFAFIQDRRLRWKVDEGLPSSRDVDGPEGLIGGLL